MNVGGIELRLLYAVGPAGDTYLGNIPQDVYVL